MAFALMAGCAATEGDGVERTDALRLVDEAGAPLGRVPEIRGVSVQDGLRVEVVVDTSTTSPVLTADANLFELIEGRVDDESSLLLRAENIEPTIAPVVRLQVGELEYLSAREEGTSARVTGVRRDDARFGLAASEGAVVEVTGRCASLDLIASDAEVTADELACARGSIDAQGGSRIEARLSDSVTVTASGESEIVVVGSPGLVERRLTDDSVLTLP